MLITIEAQRGELDRACEWFSEALEIDRRLAEELGVGTGCGSCREFAQMLIDEYAGQPPLYHAA